MGFSHQYLAKRVSSNYIFNDLQKLGTLLINLFIQSIHHLIQLHRLVQPLSDSFNILLTEII